MAFKVLIFDFFGVICSEIAPFWLARHFSPSEAIAIKGDLVHAADVGTLSQDAMFSALSTRSQVPADQIEQEWHSFVHIDTELVDFIQDLKPKYKLGLLTNSPSPFVRKILQQNDLLSLFESIVISSEIGCAKPDPQIYESILRDLLVSANQALLIDDNPANVAGALAIGMSAIEYKSCNQIRGLIEH